MVSSVKSNASQSQSVDMSTKVGGRVFHPAVPVVDGSGPTEIELLFQRTLDEYCKDNIPLETVQGMQRRERVLNRMGTICREWIKAVCIAKGLPLDVVENAGGQLFTSGSYRLGVHEPGADIDTILVAPNFCRRQDFFGTMTTSNNPDDNTITTNRDPNSLAERIRSHPDVTNFVPVEGAAVPLLTFDWEGINIDLLFARLNQNTTVPPDFDIDNDAVLDGADSATEKSLNGPRVTNLIAAIVSGTPERYQTFLTVVRCVRKWAKTRGLYSNKMGYWGGVNINIGVALAIQLYPNACPASLLRKFFLIFKTWRWPQPVMLTKPHDAGYGLPVWNPTTQSHNNIQKGAGGGGATAVAPMITPAYPAMNSTLSISRQTLQILQEEFNRANDIIDTLWKEFCKNPKKVTADSWRKLYEPSDFFISYPKYLSLCIVGPSQADVQSWAGFVESRLRKLVSDLLSRSLPVKKIQLWPKKIEVCIADKGALLTNAQRQNCVTYFIGYQIDMNRMRGEQLNVEVALQNFREWDLSRYQPLVPGMDILAKSFTRKTLPKICFDGMYQGGKVEAMKKRRQIMNADPVRQERKRIQRLEELKARMADLQNKKRKREEIETATMTDTVEDGVEESVHENIKAEDGSTTQNIVATSSETVIASDKDSSTVIVESEETDLLESALDTIQDAAGDAAKSREEAEQDRQKLLSGEVYQQDDVTGNNDDDDSKPNDDEEKAKIAYANEVDEEVAYTGEDARQVFLGTAKSIVTTDIHSSTINTSSQVSTLIEETNNDDATETFEHKDIRSLPISKEVAGFLSKHNYRFVSDDEMIVLGGSSATNNNTTTTTDTDVDTGTETDTDIGTDTDTDRNTPTLQNEGGIISKGRIEFLTKFEGLIELDAYGLIIDKGDDDYIPSSKWIGERKGFEYKLGIRGLGYYRTGKEVVVPSNIPY